MSRPVSFIDTSETSDLPWYREVNRDQWRAFLATFYGWVLDGFDFTILTFILIDIQESFTVDKALAGALGTVTLIFRMVAWWPVFFVSQMSCWMDNLSMLW